MKLSVHLILVFFITSCASPAQIKDASIINNPELDFHIVDLQKQHLRFYSVNTNGRPYSNIGQLKSELDKANQTLIFAMNGGMFDKDLSSQGLYIENGELINELDTNRTGYGNFYLQPNGVFYLTKDKKTGICRTEDFKNLDRIQFATQSGPLLVIDGAIHPKLTEGSKNLHIRNGVGILPNGNLLFAISNQTINFFDFATFFKSNGCNYALYLDGFVSKMYLPQKNWHQLNGQFGIIIAETAD